MATRHPNARLAAVRFARRAAAIAVATCCGLSGCHLPKLDDSVVVLEPTDDTLPPALRKRPTGTAVAPTDVAPGTLVAFVTDAAPTVARGAVADAEPTRRATTGVVAAPAAFRPPSVTVEVSREAPASEAVAALSPPVEGNARSVHKSERPAVSDIRLIDVVIPAEPEPTPAAVKPTPVAPQAPVEATPPAPVVVPPPAKAPVVATPAPVAVAPPKPPELPPPPAAIFPTMPSIAVAPAPRPVVAVAQPRKPQPKQALLSARAEMPVDRLLPVDAPRPVAVGVAGNRSPQPRLIALAAPVGKPAPVEPAAVPIPTVLPATDNVVQVGNVVVPLPPEVGTPTPPADQPRAEMDSVSAPKYEADVVPVVAASDRVRPAPPAALPVSLRQPDVEIPIAPTAPPPAAAVLDPAPPVVLPAPTPFPAGPGTIEVGGVPMPYGSLEQLVEGQVGGFTPGCAACGGGCPPGRPCAAGRPKCEPFPAKTWVGRGIGLMYEGICCPDPCYQGKYEPVTAAGFFLDAPRPVSQTIIRWDYAHRLQLPDRGEFFFARADGNGKGPTPNPPNKAIGIVDNHELYLVNEIALGAFSTTIGMPYRSVNPGVLANSAAGFSDLQIATKSLLFDSELFMLAFQFKTYVPTGNFRKGLGTGHVSLEPSAIAGLRFGPKTYGVAQLMEWIPLGGDPDYMGAMLRYNFSLNHILWQPVHDVQLVGTLEAQGYSFQDGAFTDPVVGNGLGSGRKLSGQTFMSMGPGMRLFYCNKFDMGVGTSFGVTGLYYAQEQLRLEFRYRY